MLDDGDLKFDEQTAVRLIDLRPHDPSVDQRIVDHLVNGGSRSTSVGRSCPGAL